MSPCKTVGGLLLLLCGVGCQEASVATVRRVDPSTRGRPAEERIPTLRDHVEWLAALDPPRSHAHPESMAAAADYVAEAFEASGGGVRRQRFTVGGTDYQNVVARWGPSEGAVLVVGAHYDVCGDQPGADDNASGVAVLLHLARQLQGVSLGRPVELVAYALEEPPHFGTDDMGSAVHARSLTDDDVEVFGMLCLEMLGYFSDEADSQEYPLPALAERFGTVGDFVVVVGRPADRQLVDAVHSAMAAASPLRCEVLLAPQLVQGVDFSDHRNYWAERFPALMVTDTAFFRNPHYHEVTDAPATLDYARMEQAARGVTAAVRALTRPSGS